MEHGGVWTWHQSPPHKERPRNVRKRKRKSRCAVYFSKQVRFSSTRIQADSDVVLLSFRASLLRFHAGLLRFRTGLLRFRASLLRV